MKILKRKTLAALLALSLLASILPLGAQPALAAAPNGQVIYVGGVKISSTGYWTTDSEGSVTAYTEGGTPTDHYIHYDAENNVLTLHNATIKEALEYGEKPPNSLIFGAAIGVLNQKGAAELTIELEGTNTIAEVGKGIFVLASSTGAASLTITGGGSLTASGSVNAGIWVQSNGGNATLSIENAEVTTTSSSSDGVLVQAKDGSNASLTVNGGSLTASGGTGIRFQFGTSTSGSGTPSLNVSNNAIVRANGNAGGITSNATAATPSGTGIVFNGNDGTVYGSVTLQEDLTIGEGERLDIPSGASLTIGNGATLTNEGTVTNSGTLTNNGTIDNYGTLSGTIVGTGKVNNIPAYTFNYPSTLTLTDKGGGSYRASGALSLSENPVLPGNGNVVVYGTNKAELNTLTLSKEDDPSQTIPFTIKGVLKSNPYSAYLDKNQTKVFAVLDGKTAEDAYTIEVACDSWDMKEVLSGTYAGTFKLYVGYTTDENVGFGAEVKDVDLSQLTAYEVKVTLENTLGLGITIQPSDVTVGEGNAATFNVAASGSATLTYQWQQSTDGGSNWTNITGATDASYTIDRTTTDMSGNQYRCEVKDGDGNSVTSNAATLTVTEQPTYQIAVDPAALNFGSIDDDQAAPAAQTVTVKNSGNQRVTLVQPTAENFEIGKLSETTLEPDATATFTIQPKDKLPRGSYSEQIAITGDNNVSETLTASFTVKEPPYSGKYSYEVSTSVGDHGSLTVDRYATEGEKVTITVTPDEAYKLDDLSVTAGGKEVALTAGGDGTYTFTMPSADVKISATFAEDPDWTEPEEPATDVSDLFIDIARDAWYKDAVQYAYDSGLMTGVSANEFAPEATTTRAMIVSMLARLEGVESAESAGFADVAANDWYATAVNWAAASGITSGTGDGNFSPNTAITREQLAAILMNYAQYKGQDVSARATLDTYNDATAISSWANDVMSWAVAEGLLTGVTNDQLQPQGNATRAQVAAILQRFLDN